MSKKKETYSKIEQSIRENIKLRRISSKRKETLEEFLIKFFTSWNNTYPTIHINTDTVQTPTGKRRSIGDIYNICKYYYPNCTLEQVSKIVANDLFEKVPRFRTSYCSTIHKRVYYQGSPWQTTGKYNVHEPDEHGKTLRFWSGKPEKEFD